MGKRYRFNQKGRNHRKSSPVGFILDGRILKVFLVVTLVVTVVGQVVLANSLSTAGEKIRELEAEKKEISASNTAVREELAILGSLERIKGEAEERLGMKDGESVAEFLVPPRLAAR